MCDELTTIPIPHLSVLPGEWEVKLNPGRRSSREDGGFMIWVLFSLHPTLIWLVINYSNFPKWSLFSHDSNWWVISLCPHLDPQNFSCNFSLLSLWGGKWWNSFGGHLPSTQGQPTTHVSDPEKSFCCSVLPYLMKLSREFFDCFSFFFFLLSRSFWMLNISWISVGNCSNSLQERLYQVPASYLPSPQFCKVQSPCFAHFFMFQLQHGVTSI